MTSNRNLKASFQWTQTAGALLFKTIPSQVPLLETLINEGAIGMIAGDTGAGKSFLSLNIAYAVAAGLKCAPWGRGAGVPVMYLDGEMGEELFKKRLQHIGNNNRYREPRGRAGRNLHIFGKAWSPECADLDSANAQSNLLNEIADKGVKLLIIDNLDTLCPTALSKPAAWKNLIDWVQRLSRRNVAVILVHHNNKKGVQHGSSEKTRQMHFVMSIKKSDEQKVKNQAVFTMSMDKERDQGADLEAKARFVIRTRFDPEFNHEATSVTQEDIFSEKHEREGEALKHFKANKNGKEIAKLMELSEPTVTRIRQSLVKQGLLV